MKSILFIGFIIIGCSVASAVSNKCHTAKATQCPVLPEGVAVKCSNQPPRVLGVTDNKEYDIFLNTCAACYAKNDIRTYYELNQCPQWFVAPDCNQEGYAPACGYDFETKTIKTYPNYCYACTSGKSLYFDGKCPKLNGHSNQGGGI